MRRIKICGITSIEEAGLANRLGADAFGLLVGQRHVSNDFISPELALKICNAVPPFITPVLVTHLEDPADILSLASVLPCPVIQLHSQLEAALLRDLSRQLRPKKVIALVSVDGEGAVKRAIELSDCADAIVLDSIDRSTNRVGGTGLVHDWSLSARIVRQSRIPVVLAGGLTPQNLRQAISIVKPWAVDVNSGVETADGKKSEELIKAFITEAKIYA